MEKWLGKFENNVVQWKNAEKSVFDGLENREFFDFFV